MKMLKQINDEQNGSIYDTKQLEQLVEEKSNEYVVVFCINTTFECQAKDAIKIIKCLEASHVDYVKNIHLKVTVRNTGDTFSVAPMRLACKNAMSVR